MSNALDKYFIMCIAWAFRINGKNFIKTMLSSGKIYDIVYVVSDQKDIYIFTCGLVRLSVNINETEKYGYYYMTNEGGYIG